MSLILALTAFLGGQEAVGDLVEKLAGEARSCSDPIYGTLGKHGAVAIDAISVRLKVVKPGDGWEQHNLLHALAHIGGDAALQAVVAHSGAKDWLTRTACYDALAHFDRDDVRKRLVELLATEKDPTALGAVCSALLKLKEKKAVPALLKVAAEGPMPAPFSALGALEELGDAETGKSLAALYETRKDDSWMGPSIAVTAAKLGAAELEPVIAKLLDTKSHAALDAGEYFLRKGDLGGAKPYLAAIAANDRRGAWRAYQALREIVPDLPSATPVKEIELSEADGRSLVAWFAEKKARLEFDKVKRVFRARP